MVPPRSGLPPGFRDAVLAVVAAVPRGRVIGYGQIAAAIGHPRHARHVGHVLASLPDHSPLPWHRVLRSSGVVAPEGSTPISGDGPYRPDEQRLRLALEGITLRAGRVPMRRYAWLPAPTPAPAPEVP